MMTHLDSPLPTWLLAELRSDQAGETGAVAIYDGILAVTRDGALRAFAERHRQAELGHLRRIEAVLPLGQYTRLLGVWRFAGWLTGALPALFGPAAVYATIDAVESFVDLHYQAQLDWLASEQILPDIASMLRHCQEEEIQHRDEARSAGKRIGALTRLWCRLVDAGSRRAVMIARRI